MNIFEFDDLKVKHGFQKAPPMSVVKEGFWDSEDARTTDRINSMSLKILGQSFALLLFFHGNERRRAWGSYGKTVLVSPLE